MNKKIVGLALLCALLACLVAAAPAAAFEYTGGQFPMIHGPGEGDEYTWTFTKGFRQTPVQVSPTEIDVIYEDGEVAWSFIAEEAWDAAGTRVPTTVELIGLETVKFVVHDREGTYQFPITAGVKPISGVSFFIGSVTESHPTPEAAAVPAPSCDVPAVVGLSRRAAAKKLRAADCALGTVHLAKGAKAQGKVVKQFHAAGTPLAAGAPVAVKLG